MKTTEMRGLKLSPMTLGTAQFGLHYGMANHHGKPGTEEAGRMMAAAAAAGVNCLDTARAYGNSEEVIGAHLAKHPDMLIVSKFKINRAPGLDAHSVREQIEESVGATLKALNKPKIELLLLHDADDLIDLGDKITPVLRDLRERGLIGRAGVSVYEARQIDAMLEDEFYEAVQLPLNVLDQRLIQSGRLGLLKQAGRIVFVRSVFLQGLLLMETPPEELTVAAPFLAALQMLAAAHDLSMAKLALSFVRDLDGVSSLVIGAETTEQIRENAVLFETPPLPAEVVGQLRDLAYKVPIEQIMKEIIIMGGRAK